MSAITRRRFVTLTGAAALTGLAAPASAASGYVQLKIVSAGFIIGATGGEGVLTFGGRRYQLSIGGVSAGATIGASGARLHGTATGLRRASDIAGVYSKVGAGMAAVHGEQAAELVNANGVHLRLQGRETGLMLSLDLSGMAIGIK